MSLTAAERRLKRVLRAVAGLILALTIALLVVHEIGAVASPLREPPWLGVAVGAGVLLVLLSVYAAGEPRRRSGLLAVLVLTLTAAALLQVASLLAGADPAGALTATSADGVLVALAALELVVAAAVALAARSASTSRRGLPTSPASSHWTSDANAGLRPALAVLGVLAVFLAAAAALGLFVDTFGELFAEPLLTAHAAAAATGWAALAFYVAAGIRERLPLTGVLAATLAVAAAAAALGLRHAQLNDQIAVLGIEGTARAFVLVGIGGSAALATLLLILRRIAFRRRLRPLFLGATEYRALMALSDVIVQGPDEAVPPRDIAANADRCFDRIRARRRWVHRVGLIAMQLHPLLSLKAPFSELDAESRLEHLKAHFQRDVANGFGPDAIRRFVQAMMRVANQLTYAGYYSDRRSYATVGYTPFEERTRYPELERAGHVAVPDHHPLTVSRPGAVEDTEVDTEICVIGSGAAGAVLAYRLAATGASVVVLERGDYVEPRQFSSDEVDMIGRLYGDGVFQQTEDFRFTVLQGSCVGGSTVVNNAVSIPPPEHVLERWNTRHAAGLDVGELQRSTERIERWLSIHSQDEGPRNPQIRLNPSAPKFLAGVAARSDEPGFSLDVSTVRANIDGCVGCGYCNIGCRYGKKLSMLDTVLPWAQRDFGHDRVRIFSECSVERIVAKDGRAREVRAKLSDGRTLRVRADKVVVAAGAIASSYLLLRSGIGKGLPVGRHVSFNMGAPLTAEFEDDLDAYDGLQISHVALPPAERGWVFETWWNPPVSQALNMPGWFEAHYENMRRYRKLMAVGVLVGTERNGSIGRALTGGPAVRYVPTQGDLRKLADGLIELGQILFAGGAKAVMLNAWNYYRFTSPNGLLELPAIMSDPSLVTLGTGHPQGGNAISSDPALGVVDPGFRVHGYSNVYVCDASVFPSSLTVNPQLTVMTLADYAAPRIADGTT